MLNCIYYKIVITNPHFLKKNGKVALYKVMLVLYTATVGKALFL